MALNAYLRLVGQKQGEIKGGVTQKGREGSILVIAVSHDVSRPFDLASGLPTGKRLHRPLVITKELDRASPLLWQALVGNESLSSFELRFWTPQIAAATGAGTEVQHYTIKLLNAHVSDIRFTMPNNRNPELARYSEYEEVSFIYQHIEWTWTQGGITAMDDWTSP